MLKLPRTDRQWCTGHKIPTNTDRNFVDPQSFKKLGNQMRTVRIRSCSFDIDLTSYRSSEFQESLYTQ
jgi:hypothetical protein